MSIIHARAYYADRNLIKFIIPKGCTAICEGAFATSSLSEIEFSDTVLLIGKYAFAGLLNLKELVIPEGVEEIGKMAFTGCIQLKQVSLPNTLKYIGRGAFYGCNRLERIEVSQRVYELMRLENEDVLELCVIKDAEAAEIEEELNQAEERTFETEDTQFNIGQEAPEEKFEEIVSDIDENVNENMFEFESCIDEKTDCDEPYIENCTQPSGFDADKLHYQITVDENATQTIAEYMGYDAASFQDITMIPLEKMNLSRRAYNALKRVGINDFAEIMHLSGKDLLQIRNLGKKSMIEILQVVHASLEQMDVSEINDCSEDYLDAQEAPAPNEMSSLANCTHLSYLKTMQQKMASRISKSNQKILFREMLALWCEMEATPEEMQAFEGAFADSEVYLQLQKTQIADMIRATHNYGMTESEIAEELVCIESGMDLEHLLNQMLEDGTLRSLKGKYVLNCMTLQEYLNEIQKERTSICVKKRLQGETLQEIAEETGITRERVRQICNKAFQKLLQQKDAVYEHCYAAFYEKYNVSPKEIRVIFSETMALDEYLKQWGKRGDLPLEDACEDETLSKGMRKIIAEYLESIDDDMIVLDGEAYPRERQALMEYAMKKYCVDAMNVDEYMDTYNAFLREHELDEAGLRIMQENRRYVDSHLADSNKVLWSLNRRLRYYDIDARDYQALLQAIQLQDYHNIEISMRLLMRLHPEVMRQYDIRDEYELHNLLKKLHVEEENPSMEFLRMPMVRFGNFDREAFVLDVLIECAPCDRDTLTKEIENKTGVLPETIGSVWLQCLNDYYHMGIYSIDAPAMPSALMQAMKDALHEEAYTMDEVRHIYRRISNGMDENYLSPYNLKQLGFNVYSKLVIVNTENANSYFTRKLTQEDVVDNTDLQKRFGGIGTYSAILNKLKNTYEIIEFAPNQLISIRKLRSFGIDKNQLRAFCDEVDQQMENGEFFSMKSLRKQGAEFELEALGFDDMFLESILREDDRFRYGRFGGGIIFSKTPERDNTSLTRGDLLKWMMRDCKSADIDDLIDDIHEQYGCTLDRGDIQTACFQAGYYWGAIMERVYVNDEAYYDEV